MNTSERVKDSMKQGCCCSQAVFNIFAESLGFQGETAMKLAAGFGGGIGSMAETCGAVSAAVMVIGLKCDSGKADRDARQKTYEQVREFARRFKKKHRHLACRDLLGCDISTPSGLTRARNHNLFATNCVEYAQTAALILEEMFPTQ